MGGPAAWLRLHRGCITVGIDLMEENVRAARVLFDDRMSMVSSANGLPFEDDTFDAVWAVGVLEMLREKERAFVECARVLRPGGRMVVYTFTAQAADLSERPSANAFASPAAVSSIVRRVGLEVMDARPWPVHSPPPAGWTAVRAAVADEVRARHGLEDDFGRVRAELDTFNRLRSSREIEPWRYVLLKLAR
jgi:SAM-dependent methyltransferase